MQEYEHKYSGDHQYRLIKPYLEKISRYDPSMNGNIVDFAYNIITTALACRAEHEEIPEYVRQRDHYIIGSEINIVSTIMSVIASSVSRDLWNQEDMKNLYIKVLTIASYRNWPEKTLKGRIMSDLGMNLPIMLDDLSPQTRTNTDYN